MLVSPWFSSEQTLNLYTCVCSVAQSCLTLCNPMDCSASGSSVHGVLQARILEWVPFPTPGDLPDPGIKPRSLAPPALAGKFSATAPPSRKWSNQRVIFVVFISFLKISKLSIFSLWRLWSNFLCVVHLSIYSLQKKKKLTPAMLLIGIPLNSEFTVTNTWVDYLFFLSSVSYL